jgi:hypothetical protein
MSGSHQETVIAMAQMMVRAQAPDGRLTREMIAGIVDQVLGIQPADTRAAVDRNAVIAELEARFAVWIGEAVSLVNNIGHVAWLTPERTEGRRFWKRYRGWLTRGMAENSVESLDRETERVLALLEDPDRPGPWDRRGLVVGHVQSGKTSNYIGLICKAADAGYKVIIVLAGMHNSLRSQTQLRLDAGFVGYESMPPQQELVRPALPVGAGDLDPRVRADTITNRNENGDFSKAVAQHFGITPGGKPLLFVMKKNVRVLSNLLEWVQSRVATSQDAATGQPLVRDAALLLIDDEADNASVDTGDLPLLPNGIPDPDYDPTRINGLIRRILRSFDKSAYVGYTATPFANIFIHDLAQAEDYGDDLFPRSFIINLPAPSNYVGPVQVFGLEPPNDDGTGGVDPLPLVRHIDDHAASLSMAERRGWVPPKHRNGHVPLVDGEDRVPASLSQAIHAFILACAARRARGQRAVHNSMLVHVTRFTSVQAAVRSQVEAELNRIRRRIRLEGDTTALRHLWQSDFEPTTARVIQLTNDPSLHEQSWDAISNHILPAAEAIEMKTINGSAKDVLDYEIAKETGLSVIVIGGEKLSRGLTLEDLSISYFLRPSGMYDALMQMGRWFGYRPGFLDLCRLYTTADLQDWFEHITMASEKLRAEFNHMASVGGTPKDYGLRVQSHPALMVTSRVKMRHGQDMRVSFAGAILETTVFHRDPEIIQRNYAATQRLLDRLGVPTEGSPSRDRPGGRTNHWRNSLLWNAVPAADVITYLGEMRTHPDAREVDSDLLRRFINQQNTAGELTRWTVMIVSGETEWVDPIQSGMRLVVRGPHPERDQSGGRFVIRRLLNPRDETIDLDLPRYERAWQRTIQDWRIDPGRSRRKDQPDTPSGPCIREQRSATDGLLLLYPLSPEEAKVDSILPLIGFGLSFPASQNARQVTYRVNNVYLQQEGGDAT